MLDSRYWMWSESCISWRRSSNGSKEERQQAKPQRQSQRTSSQLGAQTGRGFPFSFEISPPSLLFGGISSSSASVLELSLSKQEQRRTKFARFFLFPFPFSFSFPIFRETKKPKVWSPDDEGPQVWTEPTTHGFPDRPFFHTANYCRVVSIFLLPLFVLLAAIRCCTHSWRQRLQRREPLWRAQPKLQRSKFPSPFSPFSPFECFRSWTNHEPFPPPSFLQFDFGFWKQNSCKV